MMDSFNRISVKRVGGIGLPMKPAGRPFPATDAG